MCFDVMLLCKMSLEDNKQRGVVRWTQTSVVEMPCKPRGGKNPPSLTFIPVLKDDNISSFVKISHLCCCSCCYSFLFNCSSATGQSQPNLEQKGCVIFKNVKGKLTVVVCNELQMPATQLGLQLVRWCHSEINPGAAPREPLQYPYWF